MKTNYPRYSQNTVFFQYENVPEDVFWTLKQIAVEKDVKLKDVIMEAWKQYIDNNRSLITPRNNTIKVD